MSRETVFAVVKELAKEGKIDVFACIEKAIDEYHWESIMIEWILQNCNPTLDQIDTLGVFEDSKTRSEWLDKIPAQNRTIELTYKVATQGSKQTPCDLESWKKILEFRPSLALRLWKFLVEVWIPKETEDLVQEIKLDDEKNNLDFDHCRMRHKRKRYYISKQSNELLKAILETNNVHWKRVLSLHENSRFSIGGERYDPQDSKESSSLAIWLLKSPLTLNPQTVKERFEVFSDASFLFGYLSMESEYMKKIQDEYLKVFSNFIYDSGQFTAEFIEWLVDVKEKNFRTDFRGYRDFYRENYGEELFKYITERRSLNFLSIDTLISLGSKVVYAQFFATVRSKFSNGDCTTHEACNFLLTVLNRENKHEQYPGLYDFVDEVSRKEDLSTALLLKLGARYKCIGDRTTEILMSKINDFNTEIFGPTENV